MSTRGNDPLPDRSERMRCSECGREPFNPDVRAGSRCAAPGCHGAFVFLRAPDQMQNPEEDR